jgi:hypothetical protein
MVGNLNDRPILKAAKSFAGLGVVSSDEKTGGDGGTGQCFIYQNNFLRQATQLPHRRQERRHG